MAANPLPGELDLPDDVAGSRPPLDLLTNEGRVALTGSLHKDPATAPRAKKRPWWAKPATVFATACLLVFGAIGIVVVSNGGQPDFVDDSAPATVPTPADGTSGVWIDYPILDTAIAADGSLWAATDRSILRWDTLTGETTVFTTEDGLPSMGVYNLQAGADGTIWVGTAGWMALFDGGTWTVVNAPTGSPGPLAVGPDGEVWTVFGERSLARFDGSDWELFEVAMPDSNSTASPEFASLDVSYDGTVWAGTHERKGVFSFDGTDWTHYTTSNGLPARVGSTVAAAPDGSVWAGSEQLNSNRGGGVAHFDGVAWTHYSTEDGLLSMNAEIAVGADGTTWAIHDAGVSRFDGSSWTAFPDITGRSHGASVDATGKLWMPAAEAGVISVIGFDGVDITRLTVPMEKAQEPQTQPTVALPAGTWNPILATTRATPAPTAATCPPGTDPNSPGPADQERPEAGGTSLLAAAFDRHAGHIVYVDTLGETWTFDVCTNTWLRMNPTGAMISGLSGGMVYDVDSDLTIALGFEHISVYDANTNTWTQPSNSLVGIGPGLIVPTGAVYDSVTGLIITSNHRWTSETSPLYWEFWAYDVDTNEWTLLGPLDMEPEAQDQLDFLGYSEQLDRLIVAGSVDGEVGTILVDPRTGDVTVLPIESPVVDLVWPNETYGAAGGTVFATANTMDTPHDICGFDANVKSWTACFDTPGAAQNDRYERFDAMVGDPINQQLILINGIGGGWEGPSVTAGSDVWAINLDTGEWTQLLEPSNQ
jgi:sugar lactone lactonase YvrE